MRSDAPRASEEMVGVILAAGESRRFGSPKQLLPFGDTTLLGQVVRNVNASRLERVMVVLGREAEAVRRSVPFARARVVDNSDYPAGCASSLLAALDTAGDCAALVLLLGDQPGAKTEYVDRVSEAWRRERPWACIASYRGDLGHPLIFAREAFEDLRKLHGDKAVWRLVDAFPQRLLRVDINADLPLDVDTPEDYEVALAQHRLASQPGG